MDGAKAKALCDWVLTGGVARVCDLGGVEIARDLLTYVAIWRHTGEVSERNCLLADVRLRELVCQFERANA